jgi:hypothetical protein
MIHKIITLSALVAAPLLSMPTKADAWGAAHVGYTHVGPNGVYHAGKTAAVGPGGAYAGGHAGAYGYGGASYHAGYAGAARPGYGGAYGGYHYDYRYTGGAHYNYGYIR